METAYEAIYIVETNLPDEQVNATVEKYSSVVSRSGGVVDDVDRWEPRRLAYEVKTRREGQYIIMNFRSEPAAKDELDRIFRISDDVLRHMVVRQDPKADRYPSKTRAAETERREREFAARTSVAPSAEAQPVTDLGVVTVPHPNVAPPQPNPAVDVDETPTTVTDTPDGTETSAEAAEEIREGDGSPD